MAASAASVIKLSAASQAFVNNRANALGAWVIASYADCILLGIVLCQVTTFFRSQTRGTKEGVAKHYIPLVCVVTLLSLLKTAQAIGIVYVQNVLDFANPDVARTLLFKAWYQVSAPTVTGFTGLIVQGFFALRFYKLAGNNFFLVIPIICSMSLGFAGVCLSLHNIMINNVKAKVMWLLVHLISVFMTDFFITCGTCWALRRRGNGGLASTQSLINRLMRIVFEAAIPPTIVAAIDLVMTQTLDANHLLWHLLLNYMLQKLYVISLMYTLNCIGEYRERGLSTDRQPSSNTGRHLSGAPYSYNPNTSKAVADLELGSVVHGEQKSPMARSFGGEVFVSTQIVSHTSPPSAASKGSRESQGTIEKAEYEKHSAWQPDWDRS